MSEATETLWIPEAVHDAMVAHCVAEAPHEACGLLTGRGKVAARFVPLRNAQASETRYEADSRDLIEAVVDMRARGEAMLAIYHSHPRWEAVPSRTDLETNYYGDLPRIIVSLLGKVPEVRVWRLEPESYEELRWEIGRGGVEPGASAS